MEQFDAIVIGSGFGGAVAACRLSQAGYSVLLIERGRRYEAGDFPALPDDDRLLPDLRRWVWSRDEGLWDINDLGEIITVQAAGYGGGSLLYANVHLRPPEGTFDATYTSDTGVHRHWPAKFGGSRLEEYFDLAAYMMSASPISQHPEQPFPKTEKLEQAARQLGRRALRPPLTVNYQRKPADDDNDAQEACVACGKCCTGCPEGAKNSLDFNYLATAERNGAQVRTQCEVTGIEQGGGEQPHWTVHYVDHLCASLRTVSCKYVFLCAGTLHSTRLLACASLREGSKAVQERVGLGYFPNADAAGMIYETAEECSPSKGPTITTGTVHWQDDRFFIIQDGGYAAELERLLGLLRAPLWAGRNRTQAARKLEHEPRLTPRKPTDHPGVALISPLDGLLDAAREGRFRDACPPRIRDGLPAFLKEIEEPLLLPSVVEATLDRSLRKKYEGSWLRRLVAYDSPLGRWLRELLKRGLWGLAGDRDVLADQAFRSVLSGADLDRHAYVRDVFNYDGEKATRRMMLLAMGQDSAPGVLIVDKDTRAVVADLDLFRLIDGYTEQELLMKDIARELGGELRLNPLWSFFGKPITVHNQGGCRMSEVPAEGVTTPDGQVHGCPGLYVMDGSVLCQSVGVNPSPTILAISEMNIRDFIRAQKGEPRWPEGDNSAGAKEYRAQKSGGERWIAQARRKQWDIRPTPPVEGDSVSLGSEPLGLQFRESFHGFLSEPESVPEHDADYRVLEMRGRPQFPFELELLVSCANLSRFFEDMTHRLELSGTLKYTLPGDPRREKRERAVRGHLNLLIPRYKPYALPQNLAEIQRRIAGSYTTEWGAPAAGEERFMHYLLDIADDGLRLEGYKRVRQDPGLDAWRDTTALFTRLGTPNPRPARPLPHESRLDRVLAAGVLHVDLNGFLYKELPSFEATGGEACNLNGVRVTGTTDAARVNWAIGKFASFFFGTLQRVYSPTASSLLDAIYRPSPNNVRHDPRSLQDGLPRRSTAREASRP